jgi:O-antigen/teichoic acid export membrane protein
VKDWVVSLREFWANIGRYGAAYLTAESLSKGGVYILFVWLATLLSVADFGLLNVFVSVLTLLGVAVGLGVPEGTVRFYVSDQDSRAVFAMSLAVPMAAGLVLLGLAGPWSGHLAAALNMPHWLLLLAMAGGPLVAVRQAGLGLFRARRDPRAYVLTRIVEPGVFLVGVGALAIGAAHVAYGQTALVYLVAVAGAGLVGVVLGARRVGLHWNLDPLPGLLLFSLPLVAHGFAMTGLALFDQVVLQQILGSGATGAYAFAYRFGMVMSLLVFGLAAAWGPLVLARLRVAEGEGLRGLASTAFSLLMVSSIVLAWAVPPVAAWLGGPRYAEALPLIPLVVYAYLWLGLYGLAAPYLYHRDQTGRLAVASGVAFAANAGLNYLTIPYWGPVAAALTTILGYVLLAFLAWRMLGPERSELALGQLIGRACAVAPFIVSAAYVYG